MEAGIRGILAALEIQNWYQHLMANLVGMGHKDIVQGEVSQGNLVNVEKERTGGKGSGKGNIDSL